MGCEYHLKMTGLVAGLKQWRRAVHTQIMLEDPTHTCAVMEYWLMIILINTNKYYHFVHLFVPFVFRFAVLILTSSPSRTSAVLAITCVRADATAVDSEN